MENGLNKFMSERQVEEISEIFIYTGHVIMSLVRLRC